MRYGLDESRSPLVIPFAGIDLGRLGPIVSEFLTSDSDTVDWLSFRDAWFVLLRNGIIVRFARLSGGPCGRADIYVDRSYPAHENFLVRTAIPRNAGSRPAGGLPIPGRTAERGDRGRRRAPPRSPRPRRASWLGRHGSGHRVIALAPVHVDDNPVERADTRHGLTIADSSTPRRKADLL
jgi:hypothetical protein